MRTLFRLAWLFGLFVFSSQLFSAVLYVDLNSGAPAPPYSAWSTAAANIQEAVDASGVGDQILVTNGIYQTGGKLAAGTTTTNRVALDKAVTVQSVNGPTVTVIAGYQDPVTTNGPGSIRCAYVTNGAVLAGFTLSGGAAKSGDRGGGVWCQSTNATLTNCLLVGNVIGGGPAWGGGAFSGTLNNCVLSNNIALDKYGGGAYQSALNNCLLFNNSAGLGGGAAYSTLKGCVLNSNSTPGFSSYGGGAEGGTLNDCLLVGNYAGLGGGGADSAFLTNCVLSNNFALFDGGGALDGVLSRCLVTHNSSGQNGGGASGATLINCLVTYNSATNQGGGAFQGTLNNCTVFANLAGSQGGGTQFSADNNCILQSNSAPVGPNVNNGTFRNCCMSPVMGLIPGNFSTDPALVDIPGGDFRLTSNSPCINAGDNSLGVGNFDLDGNPRVVGGTTDVGAYEFRSPVSPISYAWLAQYGFANDGSADGLDPDGDHMTNLQEWRAGTVPTNAASAVRVVSVTSAAPNPGLMVRWESVYFKSYFVERSTNLAAEPPFVTISSNFAGQPTTTTASLDVTATNSGPYFYRVRVP